MFNLAKEVWGVNEGDLPYEDEAMRRHAKDMIFLIGAPNDGFHTWQLKCLARKPQMNGVNLSQMKSIVVFFVNWLWYSI